MTITAGEPSTRLFLLKLNYMKAYKPYKDLRIVFMGTPEFAVATLAALVASGATVVGVVTAPDKPSGRGMHLQQSAVKQYAVEHGLTVLQPEKLKNPVFLEELKALAADIQVVVAFRMLPTQVWDMPPMGTINLHGSLLPKYRGAAPINWAVINGEKETGVTTFKLQHEIDTGNILLQESLPVAEEDTAGSVHDKMKTIGAALVVKTLRELAAGTIEERPQRPMAGESAALHGSAPKIFTETCLIDFHQSVTDVHNLIRGLSPFPAAFTYLDAKVLKVFRSHIATTEEMKESAAGISPASTAPATPGAHFTDHKTFLCYRCRDGYICFDEIQLSGKKRMPVGDFLRGYRFES